jgi:hypothetical protein
MRWLLPLLAASLLTLAISLSSSGSPRAVDSSASPSALLKGTVPDIGPAVRVGGSPRVRCERPATLRLRRFEDRSARLECAGRVLVRVAVPG